MVKTKMFRAFFKSEKSAGVILILCTIISLLIANSTAGGSYIEFWQQKAGGMTVEHWINDALMAIFFLMIGLELEREVYIGELSTLKDALLPIFAAVGGMLIPASIYMLFNNGTPTQSGFGIPMATDIAFALGVLSLLGKRVPASLKIFLTALAVIDDLGAILVIAVFYSKGIVLTNLLVALGIYGALLILNRLKVRNLVPYLAGGVFMWYFMHNSGVHATIAGVLTAFAIPFGNGGEKSTSYILQKFLHKPVAFFILPVFALANTAILIEGGLGELLTHNYSLGIGVGLILGKPVGILLFSFFAVALGLSKLPGGVRWKHILSIGFLAGIGFTMSIFITLLAFTDGHVINNAKLSILLASLIAAIIGIFSLKHALKNNSQSRIGCIKVFR